MTRHAVVNARVVTCEDLTVIDDGAIICDDDRITWVGPAAQLDEAMLVDAEIIDARGMSVIPGLVDAHMHISFGEAASEEELAIHTPMAYRSIRAAIDASKVLAAGVTSACDPGGPRGIATAVRDAIDAGLVPGPRLAAAGPQITTQQGIGDTMPSPIGELTSSLGAIVRSIDDIRQEIRNEVKDRVDLIKIAGSGPGTREFGAFTLEELQAAATEAHRLDRPITIHARSRQAIADAVEARFDWIMHASYMDRPTLDTLLEQRIPIVPAMTLLVNTLESGAGIRPTPILDAVKRELDAAVAILSEAYRAGATLIAGSESGFSMTPYGEWHTREAELFVDLIGMSHHEALLAMTRDAAIAIARFGSEIGTLTPGRYADLIVVDGQPDLDVGILADRTRLRVIMQGGRVIEQPVVSDRGQRQLFEMTRIYTHENWTRERSGSR